MADYLENMGDLVNIGVAPMGFGHPPTSNQLAEMAYPTGFQSPYAAATQINNAMGGVLPQQAMGLFPGAADVYRGQMYAPLEAGLRARELAGAPHQIQNQAIDARSGHRFDALAGIYDVQNAPKAIGHLADLYNAPQALQRTAELYSAPHRIEEAANRAQSNQFARKSPTRAPNVRLLEDDPGGIDSHASYLWELVDSDAPVTGVNQKIRDAYRSGDITDVDAKALLSELGGRAKSYSEFGEQDLATVPSRYYAGDPGLKKRPSPGSILGADMSDPEYRFIEERGGLSEEETTAHKENWLNEYHDRIDDGFSQAEAVLFANKAAPYAYLRNKGKITKQVEEMGSMPELLELEERVRSPEFEGFKTEAQGGKYAGRPEDLRKMGLSRRDDAEYDAKIRAIDERLNKTLSGIDQKYQDKLSAISPESVGGGIMAGGASSEAAIDRKYGTPSDDAVVAGIDGPDIDEAQTAELAEKVKKAKGLTTGERALLVGTIGLMPALAALTSLLVKGQGRKKGERYRKTRRGRRIPTG